MTLKGTEKWHWLVSADDPRLNRIKGLTYYGHVDDEGSPGHIRGGALPVSLSSFRPALEDGAVVIRWVTQSELDNAGFNILRSDSRNGEFKQVNPDLIQGAGTTGEKSSYNGLTQLLNLVMFTTTKLKMYLSLVSVKRLRPRS